MPPSPAFFFFPSLPPALSLALSFFFLPPNRNDMVKEVPPNGNPNREPGAGASGAERGRVRTEVDARGNRPRFLNPGCQMETAGQDERPPKEVSKARPSQKCKFETVEPPEEPEPRLV